MLLDRRDFLTLLAGAASAAAVYKVGGMMMPSPASPVVPVAPPVTTRPQKLRTHPVTRYSLAELKKIKITFHNYYRDGTKFFPHTMDVFYEGLKKHGMNLHWAKFNEVAEDSDMAVVSGWFQYKVIIEHQQKNKNLIVLEPSYLQPRWKWPSIGFNGLAGYGIYPPAPNDGGERFRKHFGHFLKPWREPKGGYALLIGQVPGDRSLYGLKIEKWLQETADQLIERGAEVLYRPHPLVARWSKRSKKPFFIPKGTRASTGTLEEDLAGADYCVMYSSTTAVESVLAGVPAVVMCEGSIAWEMTSHDLSQPYFRPDREKWCSDLAWKQWQLPELEDGSAWEHVRKAILL